MLNILNGDILLKRYKILILTIFLSLGLGFLYYYFLRNIVIGLSCIGVHEVATFDVEIAKYFLWFPTFIHPFLFSLLTWWAMGFTYPKTSILFWLSLNMLAELGQSIELDFYHDSPPLIRHYFSSGVFDWFDMISIIFGAVSAYLFILKFEKG